MNIPEVFQRGPRYVKKSKKLPKTEGFFYGTDTYEEDYEKYYKKDDLAFIKSAREAIKDGKEVIYTCWW